MSKKKKSPNVQKMESAAERCLAFWASSVRALSAIPPEDWSGFSPRITAGGLPADWREASAEGADRCFARASARDGDWVARVCDATAAVRNDSERALRFRARFSADVAVDLGVLGPGGAAWAFGGFPAFAPLTLECTDPETGERAPEATATLVGVAHLPSPSFARYLGGGATYDAFDFLAAASQYPREFTFEFPDGSRYRSAGTASAPRPAAETDDAEPFSQPQLLLAWRDPPPPLDARRDDDGPPALVAMREAADEAADEATERGGDEAAADEAADE